ncbi:MAG: recombination protein O N-terminal domain-containing protein [Hydrogenobacter thermophilus]|uniref:hypothetical protein n=1 Tax=Hydrogenobacter thermophilus TaxID=940 RepID=UPI0030F7A808|nr:recombination protein O N-terminal domain-containing protein [Hydrogenobacter thermophilus]
MSFKGKVIVLRRLVVGDEDLLVKVYGWGGLMNMLVKDGALPSSRYVSIFEPFNVLELSYRQVGEIILPLDVSKVRYLSYLALESYERYMWMCHLGNFFLRWVRYYDQQLFDLFLLYLSAKVRNTKVFLIRFKLEVLKAMGLYKEELFEEDLRRAVRDIKRGSRLFLERMRLNQQLAEKIERAIEDQLTQHL